MAKHVCYNCGNSHVDVELDTGTTLRNRPLDAFYVDLPDNVETVRCAACSESPYSEDH